MDDARPNLTGAVSARDLFKAHGLRCTRQRERLYEALAATTSHPTAEELFLAVRGADESLSLATVYNTLDAFTACGLVERVPPATPSGPSRYDADRRPHTHVTMPDGAVMDVPSDLDRKLIEAVSPGVLREIAERLGVPAVELRLSLVCNAATAPTAEA